MSAKESTEKKKYKLVAPDGGYGYMIALSATIILTTATMFQGCFGLIFKNFMEELGINSVHVTVMMGIGSICAAASGFLTGTFVKFMSLRMLTLLGAVLLNIGTFGCVFANTMFTFYVFNGIFPSIALGILFNVSFTTLNLYFVEKRMMVISFCQTIIALVTMVVPMFLKWSLEEYGFRSTLLLVSGISMNCIFGAILIQPVEKYMRKVEIEEKDELLISDQELKQKPKSEVKLNDIEGNISEKSLELSEENEKTNRLTKIYNTLLDKSLRKTYLLSCVCYGPTLCMFADVTYIVMLPQALYTAHWSQDNVALAISLIGFGDLTMRIVFIFIGNWMFKFGSAEIYVAGIILALVARLGQLWTKSFIANMIFITLAGIARCSIAILLPVVIADAVLPEQFSSAMGISMMFSGLTNLSLGFAIGGVRDLTNSYDVAFYLIASCFALVAIFWTIELFYKKNKHKRQLRREYLRQKQNVKS
ncbi:unnamed protein product [Arctia plantaginis]|uniref:Major facilitator superfamily (MFS) profile domain-containing protein n=1 Tax=Arctia plantaginis TaxID=874455 RepID=A0A8S1BBP0_ARCPL|nr:unnamed protein product [Arctia plantaginis]